MTILGNGGARRGVVVGVATALITAILFAGWSDLRDELKESTRMVRDMQLQLTAVQIDLATLRQSAADTDRRLASIEGRVWARTAPAAGGFR